MMNTSAKLIFMRGKMAAGKSTLARVLAERENAILFAQDDLLEKLFPGQRIGITAFINRYSRLQEALTPLICALLTKGISVVLDFAANTKNQRAWFRLLIERTNAAHELHFIDATDAVCKSQLQER